jgi:hypothetical protein
MSLDVYLEVDVPVEVERTIPIREDGQIKELTIAEWNARYPDRAVEVDNAIQETNEVYWANITHNLNRMADEAGVYWACWRPAERGWETAEQLIEPLSVGLTALKADPDRFRALNPENGWGDYEGLVRFVEDYLAACRLYPDARVYASR